MQLYFMFMKSTIKAEYQYKTNFFFGLFANLYTYFLTYMSIWILTHKFSVIDGWNYNELVFLTALNLFTYAIAITVLYHYVSGLENYLLEGRFDRILVRPINPIISLIFDGFAWMGIGQLLVSSVFLINSMLALDIHWTAYKIIVFVFCLIGGVLIQGAALMIFGTLSFWVKKSYSLSVILFYNLKTFINYPLTIFGPFIRNVLTFVLPWALINYYPAVFVLGKQDELSMGYLLTPIVGTLMMIGAILLTQIGVKKYNSTGS
ncbi:ABC transporter permease [Paenibacillus cucumis (ex Kampfer et al. 2016)]|nr:ABC-2 family transporter protein [Paenibacillus cucumis (ex Kampfer et al. 2016)]